MNKPSIIIYSLFVDINFFKKITGTKKPFSMSMSTILYHIDNKYIKLKIKRVL